MANDKLGRASKERMAVLRNQVSYLLWHGKIETTVAKVSFKGKQKYSNMTVAELETHFAAALAEGGINE